LATQQAGGKIAVLLQAFGLSVGSCGLANVLQCAWAVEVTNPNASLKAQSGWAKKLKPFWVGFQGARILSFFFQISR